MNLLETLAAQGFCRVADARQSAGNAIRLLRDAAETYPAWLGAIGRATATVDLENYIIEDDATGALFAEALIAAAMRGVRCRVIYDWLGCLTRTRAAFWQRLRAAGVLVRCYNPPRLGNPVGWISRDHRKVLAVDGAVGFTGGLCIGHDWAGNPARGIAPWRDTAIEIHGPAVADIAAAFEDSWRAAHPHAAERAFSPQPAPQPQPPQQPGAGPAGGVDIALVDGHPNSMSLYRLEQLVAEIAERRLWLSDGYFVATTNYVRSLTGAARAGVDVRLLVPGSSNWPLVGALSQSAYRPLLESGVRVFEWNGPMMHAKTAVADGCWARIGSSNSNLASWVSNRELDVTIRDAELAAQMEAMFERDMENATEVVLRRTRASPRPRPMPAEGERRANWPKPGSPRTGGRLVAGAVGFGSTLGATLSQHRPLGGTESLVLLGGGAVLVLLALLGIFLPRVLAFPIAAVALWAAYGLLAHAWRLRREHGGPRPPR